MSELICPTCGEFTTIAHTWRVDMARLQTIDAYQCLECRGRWEITTNDEQRKRADV